MKHGAALGWTGVGAGERVDADTLLEGIVGPDALDHDDARLKTLEETGMQDDAALPVAQADAFAIGDSEPGAIGGMDLEGRPALATPRARRFGETRVEELARRRGHEAERALGVGFIDQPGVIGQLRHPHMVDTEGGP